MRNDHDTHELPSSKRRVAFVDPLDRDAAGDQRVVTTRRRQSRLALVAAETATRFAAAGTGIDPMAWMLSPRRMFGGASALEACGDRDACLRAIVLHALDDPLDAEPEYLDSLLDDDDDDDVQGGDAGGDDAEGGATVGSDACDDAGIGVARTLRGSASAGPGAGRVAGTVGGLPGPGRPRLFTAALTHEDGRGFVQAFSAIVAPSAETLRRVLRERHGELAAADAVVEEGFPRGSALIDALVSPALAHVLAQVADAPGSPLAAGLDVRVEQRFHS